MATIALYKSKINDMPRLIKDVKKSVTDFKSELSNLSKKTLKVNKSICDLDDIVSTISTSTQTQEQKASTLETFQKNSEQFIADTARIDGNVADLVNQNKEDFYDQYDYLKPEGEKGWFEQRWEDCKSFVKSAGEWCKENWKTVVKIALAVVVIAALGIAAALTGGTLAVILTGAFWGALTGGVLGGVMGGLTNMINGRSLWEGFANGALSGALTGALLGGLFGVGQVLGSSCEVIRLLGPLVKAIPAIANVSRVISLGMLGFDLLSLGSGLLFGLDSPLWQFNQSLHSNKLYNFFQLGVSVLAVFSNGFVKGMNNPVCFVAGTMILTATGFVAIENIKAGDKVISTNTETFEVEEKTVLKSFIRETSELIVLTINGEVIKTTREHPFYVKDVGFINAGELYMGDKLLDSNGNTYIVEDRKVEILDEPVRVYNFKVEDFHTYHVGSNGVLVHNADYEPKSLYDKDGDYTGGRSEGELESLAQDPAHSGSTRQADIAKGLHEREVGLGLEESGKVPGPITRDPSGQAEFFDANGQAWDVKSFNSHYRPNRGGYNLTDAMNKIYESLARGENVMLDTSNLTPSDITELMTEIINQGLEGKVIKWP